MEGTAQVGLLQLGLLWKERSGSKANQHRLTSSSATPLTRVVYKLRRMWTTAGSNLEKCGSATACAAPPAGTPNTAADGPYTGDLRDATFSDTARQFVYSNPLIPAAQLGPNGYSAGDLVPMRGCLYKLSFASKLDGAAVQPNPGANGATDPRTKYFHVERLRLEIMYNAALALARTESTSTTPRASATSRAAPRTRRTAPPARVRRTSTRTGRRSTSTLAGAPSTGLAAGT